MGRIEVAAAKRAYRRATEVGNRSEEARWANNVGDILKNDGEYVEALKWFRIDYDISVKCLPGKDLLPTCQSLDLDLDNPDAACNILMKGLKICEEEEVNEYDAMRSRLHHNLGNVFLELRSWEEAKEHIKMDIEICHEINHCQGEAKGYINLAELHNKTQNYSDALRCYGKASTLAKSMQDESALVEQIEQNIKVVKKAIKVMEELREEELRLKKLSVEMTDAKGTSEERKSMLQVHTCLERLIEKSSMVFAWEKVSLFLKHF